MAAFQFHFMALAINVMDRRGFNNEMRSQLQLKKNEVMLYYLFILQQKAFYLPFMPNKTERFSFKSGCVVLVENGEKRHQL